MRTLTLAALALIAVPAVAALGTNDLYAGVDPIARVEAWQDPYNPASTMSCVAPMTLQVQRNAGGSWDVLARGVDGAPSPLGVAGNPAIAPSSATSCPTLLLPTFSYTNMAGTPSTGLRKVVSSSTCYYEGVDVSPFTVGGPAHFLYYRAYQKACYPTAYYLAVSVAPVAMG